MRPGIIQSPWQHAPLLVTGQTTVYVTGDNGTFQTGKPKSYVILTTGQYSGTTNIVVNNKTDAHSNNCVWDQQTGRMWSRTVAGSVGPASDGKLPWTSTGSGATLEGIFAYVAAANAANLSGYSDWAIPNFNDLVSLQDFETPTSVPSPTAFPSWPTSTRVHSGNTAVDGSTFAYSHSFLNAIDTNNLKTVNAFCALVRGGF